MLYKSFVVEKLQLHWTQVLTKLLTFVAPIIPSLRQIAKSWVKIQKSMKIFSTLQVNMRNHSVDLLLFMVSAMPTNIMYNTRI